MRTPLSTLVLAVRGESPSAFDERRILAAHVALPSNTGRILRRRASSSRRLARLGATPDFGHGLLAAALVAAAAAALPSEAIAHDVAVALTLPQGERSLEASRAAPRIEREVRDSLRGERDLRQIEVSVEGNVVTLAGSVQTFWSKDQAIKRALAIGGVETVVSELEIPVAEDDNDVAQDVARAIQQYPHYTIWDHIEGSVNKGVVVLSGRVTPDQDKAGDIFERVAKVKGVQDLQNGIRTLSPSRRDQELRQALGYRVFSSEHFERFASMPNPPFHIIVDNSTVTLVGYVQSAIELHEIQRIVAQTQGIIRVENQLQTLR